MPPSDSQAFLRELDKKLWTAADRLRSNLDAPVYKHAVLGLKMDATLRDTQCVLPKLRSIKAALTQDLLTGRKRLTGLI